MKLCLCVNHFSPAVGGCEYVVKTLAEYFSTDNEVYVVTRRMSGRKTEKYLPVRVVEYDFGSQNEFIRKLEKIKPDVVLVYSDVFDFFKHFISIAHPFRLILALCGANWLYSNSGYANMLYRNIDKIEALICHSIHDRDYKLCSTKHLLEKTHVIPNGVFTEEFDTNIISKEQIVKDLKLDKTLLKKQWILNISNFFPGKGQIHLLKIFNAMKRKDVAYLQVASEVHFHSGEMLEVQWLQNARTLKEKHDLQAVLLKNIDRKYVIALFKQTNVFACTSEKEVAPIVLLEAMTAKCPWVAANVGNVEGLKGGYCITAAKNSQFHSIFDDRVVSLFAEKINLALSTPSLGDDGRLQIENELNWNKILPSYKHLLCPN